MSVPGRWARHFGGYKITGKGIRKLKFWKLPHQALLRSLSHLDHPPGWQKRQAQRGLVTSLRSHSWCMAEPGPGPTSLCHQSLPSHQERLGAASSLTAWCLALLQVGGPRAMSVITSHNVQCPGLSSALSPHLSPHPVTSGLSYEAAYNQPGPASFLFPPHGSQRACLNPSPFQSLNCPRMTTGIPSLASKTINKIIPVYVATCDTPSILWRNRHACSASSGPPGFLASPFKSADLS